MGAIVWTGYYIQIIASIVIGIILLIIAYGLFLKKKRSIPIIILVIAILLFINAIRVYYEIEEIKSNIHTEYKYQLEIIPSNTSNYKILFPIPDNKILDNYILIGNGTVQINMTEYGLALEIYSNESVYFETEVLRSKSTMLQMRAEEPRKYYVCKWSNNTNTINVDFYFHYKETDYDGEISFTGNLSEDWNIYTFNK